MYSMPRTHFGPFQAYRCGTTSRTGKPCSAVSSSPPSWVAKTVRSEAKSASRRLELKPYSAHTITCVTCGDGGARARMSRARIPPHSAPCMLNFVTQCRSATTDSNGRAVNSSWFQQRLSPSAVAPKTRNSQRSGLNLGTGP